MRSSAAASNPAVTSNGGKNAEIVNVLDLPAGGEKMRSIRGKHIGMIFQEPMTSLSPLHTIGDQITENIFIHEPNVSKKEAIDRALEMLSRVGIPRPQRLIDSYPHQYSGGMRQRFGIAQCLIGDPKLVIVDEPTAGLDPGERNRFYNILSEIGENTIVILSTHIVQDVRELCTQMAIIDKGRLLFSGNTDDALMQIRGKVWERKVEKSELAGYQANYRIISSKLAGGQPLIHAFSTAEPGNGFTRAEENLEDVFFAKLNELV